MALRVFQRGESVEAYLEVIDPDTGNYVTPTTSTKVTYKNPSGQVQVDAQDMMVKATGKLIYSFVPPADAETGWWTVFAVATDGTKVTIEEGGFELK